MRILFVTPELTPFGDTSSLGDTCAALPKALAARGHEVMVVSPLYPTIDPAARGLGRRLRKVEVSLRDDRKTAFVVYDTRSAAGLELTFLANEELFGAAPVSDGLRYGAFCKAAVEVLKNHEKGFDVVHCHGWQTALVPVLVDLLELDVGTVLTVHDGAATGSFDRALIRELGLPARLDDVEALRLDGEVSLLLGGILEADRVTTVSPSYARALLADGPVAAALRGREDELTGIAGGVDAAVWNPATDAHLEARFDPMDPSGKVRCKSALQRELELPQREDVPLIVALSALTPALGLDSLARVLSRVMRLDVQLALIGEGEAADEALATVLREHAKRWPDRMAVRPLASHDGVHRALGGADLVLVPPRQAAGGSVQLRAMRYGALPIGPRAGAAGDSVVDCDADLTTGTGFLFEADSDEGLLAAVQRGVSAFAKRSTFDRVRHRAMRADTSWERAAYLYERIYGAL